MRDLIEVYDREIVMLERRIHQHLRHDRGYRAVQAINGVGPTIAAIIVAEIGDVTRFPHAAASVLVGRADPAAPRVRHQGHDAEDHQAGLTAVALGVDRGRSPATTAARTWPAEFQRIAERRGMNKARVAIARKVLTLAYYGLRDGEIRCLAQPEAA